MRAFGGERQDFVPILGKRPRHVFQGLTALKKDRRHSTFRHPFQEELGLDESQGADLAGDIEEVTVAFFVWPDFGITFQVSPIAE